MLSLSNCNVYSTQVNNIENTERKKHHCLCLSLAAAPPLPVCRTAPLASLLPLPPLPLPLVPSTSATARSSRESVPPPPPPSPPPLSAVARDEVEEEEEDSVAAAAPTLAGDEPFPTALEPALPLLGVETPLPPPLILPPFEEEEAGAPPPSSMSSVRRVGSRVWGSESVRAQRNA